MPLFKVARWCWFTEPGLTDPAGERHSPIAASRTQCNLRADSSHIPHGRHRRTPSRARENHWAGGAGRPPYGGAVIAGVTAEQVKSLVYIAALAPDENETVADVFYRVASNPPLCARP
jgi:hypothetical protein